MISSTIVQFVKYVNYIGVNEKGRPFQGAVVLVVERNFNSEIAAQQLRLEAMATIAHRVESTAVLHRDRRKLAATIVIVGVLANLSDTQLTKLLFVHAHQIDTHEPRLGMGPRMHVVRHEGHLSLG